MSYGFTYNGIHSRDYGLVIKTSPSILPQITNITQTAPGKAGAYYYRSELNMRKINVNVGFIASSMTDYKTKLRDLAGWLKPSNEPSALIFDDEPDKTYYAVLDGTTDLSRMVRVGQGALTFLCPDPFAYGKEHTQTINDPNNSGNVNSTVLNGGTTDVYPTFSANVLKPTTFLSIITPDSEILLGKLASVEETPTDEYELVLWDQLSSLSNWTTGTYVDDGTITGTMGDGTSYQFQAADYGTNANGWHGPAVLRTLTNPLTDFQIELKLANMNSVGGLGRAEMYLLDANDNEIARMSMRDMWNNIKANKGLVTIGSETLLDTFGSSRGVWNDFDGLFYIRRIGNEWKYGIGKINSSGNEYARDYGKWVDSQGLYSVDVAKIELYLAQYESYTVTDQYFKDLKVYKINSLTDTQVSNIAQANDVITIDNLNRKVLINGIDSRSIKDISTDYFSIPPGSSDLSVYPSDVAQVSVSWQERWA